MDHSFAIQAYISYLCVPPFILSIWPIHELRWIYQTWSSWIIATRVSQILRPLNLMVLNMLPTREICDTRWDLFKKSPWKQMQVYKPQYEVNLNMWNICFFCTHTSISHFIFHSKSTMCGSIKHFWIKPLADQNVQVSHVYVIFFVLYITLAPRRIGADWPAMALNTCNRRKQLMKVI